MRPDPALCDRLQTGDLLLLRYASWRRGIRLESTIARTPAATGYGVLQAVEGGYAAALAPGRWVWFATDASARPEPAPDCVHADLSSAVVGYHFARSQLAALLRRHAPAALEADLLAPGFRRIGFASWAIELAILPDRPALAIVPRGHAENFETLAGWQRGTSGA